MKKINLYLMHTYVSIYLWALSYPYPVQLMYIIALFFSMVSLNAPFNLIVDLFATFLGQVVDFLLSYLSFLCGVS